MEYVYKNSAGFGINWLKQRIVPMKGLTLISWSQLVAGLLKCSPLLSSEYFQ